jgi:hypothetical protein
VSPVRPKQERYASGLEDAHTLIVGSESQRQGEWPMSSSKGVNPRGCCSSKDYGKPFKVHRRIRTYNLVHTIRSTVRLSVRYQLRRNLLRGNDITGTKPACK